MTTCNNCKKEIETYFWFNGEVCEECFEVLKNSDKNKVTYSQPVEDFEFLKFLDGRRA